MFTETKAFVTVKLTLPDGHQISLTKDEADDLLAKLKTALNYQSATTWYPHLVRPCEDNSITVTYGGISNLS